jgi:hypothetical protein
VSYAVQHSFLQTHQRATKIRAYELKNTNKHRLKFC